MFYGNPPSRFEILGGCLDVQRVVRIKVVLSPVQRGLTSSHLLNELQNRRQRLTSQLLNYRIEDREQKLKEPRSLDPNE